jgi:hypothetical protein
MLFFFYFSAPVLDMKAIKLSKPSLCRSLLTVNVNLSLRALIIFLVDDVGEFGCNPATSFSGGIAREQGLQVGDGGF